MTGLHLKGSCCATVFVSALPKCQQTRLVRPSYQLRERDDIDTNVFMHGLINRYAARPTGAPYDSMTLAHFAVWYHTVWYHTVCGSSKEDKAKTTSSRLPYFQFQNAMGTIAETEPGLLESACNDTRVTW